MKQEQFIYWLQGFVEIQGNLPTEAQWEQIKVKLNMVTMSSGNVATLQIGAGAYMPSYSGGAILC